MAQYTILCRQVLEYQAVVEADTKDLALWEAYQECRQHGELVDCENKIISVKHLASK